MSRTKPDRLEKIQLEYECNTCEAKPGTWCVRRGEPISYLHTARYAVAYLAGKLPIKDD